LPEVICNTSPLQYLHQIGQLSILPALVGSIVVPPAVLAELDAGIAKGLDLPQLENLQWIRIQAPIGAKAASLITDLGPGESQVLMLALEMPGSVALLDDALARRVATAKGIPIKGTLGLLLDAKRAGHLPAVKPSLDRLQELGFRIAQQTRDAVLKLAGESERPPGQ
jgi:predicted nucleic acid-binding protein